MHVAGFRGVTSCVQIAHEPESNYDPKGNYYPKGDCDLKVDTLQMWANLPQAWCS